VADTLNKRIQKFDGQGKAVAQWPVPGEGWSPGPYLEPFLAVDGQGNLYATAPTGKSVLRIGPNGEIAGQKSAQDGVSLQLPTGLTVGDDGIIYVVDTQANRVVNLGTIP
jgi:DNA-binding beta-propeller fold protein YncE